MARWEYRAWQPKNTEGLEAPLPPRQGICWPVDACFETFQWCYRFEARFCNPASPHENGNVERKVSYVRRNALSPPPVVEELEKINDLFWQQAQQDLERIHYLKKVLWANSGSRIGRLCFHYRTLIMTCFASRLHASIG